ncbi:MAG: hypothetical protein RI985_1999 [Chloroflexota bacterium]|jgi:hypothetical protein
MTQRDQLILALRTYPQRLELALAAIPVDALTATPLAGEWSIAQNVHHLADSHLNAFVRCKLIATEHEPPLKPYDQDAWAAHPDASNADISTSLAILRGLHVRWADFFANLNDADYARVGHHPEAGIMSLDRLLKGYVQHGDDHLDQIARTKAAYHAQKGA